MPPTKIVLSKLGFLGGKFLLGSGYCLCIRNPPPKKDGWCLVATEASRFWHEFCNGFFFAILRDTKSWYLNTKAMAQNLFYAMSSKILVLLIISSNEWTRGHEDCPSALVQPLEFTLSKVFFCVSVAFFRHFVPPKLGSRKIGKVGIQSYQIMIGVSNHLRNGESGSLERESSLALSPLWGLWFHMLKNIREVLSWECKVPPQSYPPINKAILRDYYCNHWFPLIRPFGCFWASSLLIKLL